MTTAANTYGRAIDVPLTNKSGGGVIAGDVVVIDTTNNDAFTTTTSASVTQIVGVAQDTIASNAIGRVRIGGYCALVNVNASVTRGHYGATFTVAKQATDAGASRTVGTFCEFLTGGTTPDAMVYNTDLLGSSLTNPMTTKGDIIIADTGGTPTRLAAGATAGMVLRSAGSAAFETWALPPGYEFDYAQGTSASVSITATVEASADTIVTGAAVSYDGSTIIMIHFFCQRAAPQGTATDYIIFYLFDGSSSIGQIALHQTPASSADGKPISSFIRLTPSNASHTYSIRAIVNAGTGTVYGGAGGAGTSVPYFIRQTKV